MSTFMFLIARMDASATVRTTTRMVIGRRIAVNTSHICQIPSATVFAAETVADPRRRLPPLRALATHRVSPTHRQSRPASKFALLQQLQRYSQGHSGIEHLLVAHSPAPRQVRLACSVPPAGRPPE